MPGGTFLAIATLVCLGVFLIGVVLARRDTAPDIPVKLYDRPLTNPDKLQMLHNLGHLFMIVAPLFWLVLAAMCFGLMGPVHNIHPIRLP